MPVAQGLAAEEHWGLAPKIAASTCLLSALTLRMLGQNVVEGLGESELFGVSHLPLALVVDLVESVPKSVEYLVLVLAVDMRQLVLSLVEDAVPSLVAHLL